ncbi:hypothetical protein HanIR_Chr03g0129951 [Helianthus annuus]|nr:hypothetical protein HanIR_Chr03g0129951 [Helianthus annuus]
MEEQEYQTCRNEKHQSSLRIRIPNPEMNCHCHHLMTALNLIHQTVMMVSIEEDAADRYSRLYPRFYSDGDGHGQNRRLPVYEDQKGHQH